MDCDRRRATGAEKQRDTPANSEEVAIYYKIGGFPVDGAPGKG